MIRNHPTPEGREMGAHLARWTEAALPKLAAMGQEDDRCKTCAFREGTVPNRCIDTVADAMKCVVEGEHMFLCHHPRAGETGYDKACYGALRARAWWIEHQRRESR